MILLSIASSSCTCAMAAFYVNTLNPKASIMQFKVHGIGGCCAARQPVAIQAQNAYLVARLRNGQILADDVVDIQR